MGSSMHRYKPRTLARHRDRTLGQSIVEFALTMPLLLLLFAGAADLGRVFFNFVALENAVKEGALYGARYPLCDDTSTLCPDPLNVAWHVENEARTAAGNALVTPASECRSAATDVAYADLRDCLEGDTYVVSATLDFPLITPIMSQIVGGSLTLRSESQAIVINQAFDPTPGLAPNKLVLGTTARNAAEIASKCVEPDPGGSPGFYRSPCLDTAGGPSVNALFQTGDTITYKVIVLNNGGTNVTGVSIVDSRTLPGTCPAIPSTMTVTGANRQWTCTYTRTAPTVAGVDLTGPWDNTLTVDGNEILPAVDAATVTIERPPADLVVDKVVSPFSLGNDGDGLPTFGGDTVTIAFNAQIPSPYVWYQVTVSNTGGQTATGLTITDTFGAFPTNANCPAVPTSLAAGATWTCKYQRSFNAAQVANNTVTATAAGGLVDSHTAVTTVNTCTGTNRVVPNLIGLTKANAQTAWTAAGFTGAMTSWSGSNGSTILTQNRQAFECRARTSTITVRKVTTP